MFPKKNRVDRKTIEKIFKEGKFVNSPNLTLKFIKNKLTQGSLPPRISFITPKTVSKKAVDRNLLRRRGYAVLKKYFNQLPVDLIGVFVFGKKSKSIFGAKKTKKYNPIFNLDSEIKNIINKL